MGEMLRVQNWGLVRIQLGGLSAPIHTSPSNEQMTQTRRQEMNKMLTPTPGAASCFCTSHQLGLASDPPCAPSLPSSIRENSVAARVMPVSGAWARAQPAATL